MIPFARSAKWLTELFTPSVVPTTSFPDRYSRDVSLVQPYDGGGWGIPALADWSKNVTTPAGAGAEFEILRVAEQNIYRLLAIQCFLGAGAVPGIVFPVVTSPGGGSTVALDRTQTLVLNERMAWFPHTPIIGPDSVLQGFHSGGDVLTVIHWAVYGVEVPLGTSFTL